jgi:fructokinase
MENPEDTVTAGTAVSTGVGSAVPPAAAIRVATAGEALIDLIGQPDGRFEACAGGAVFNLTRALARLGVATLYLNPLSGDRFGRLLAETLRRDGVALAHAQPLAQPSSLAVVHLSDDGQPDYAFYREGVADRQVTAQQLIAACAGAPQLQVVCTGALALAAADSACYLPWLRVQRQAGTLIVVDANLRPSAMPDLQAYRDNVQQALQQADLIKVSDEDLQHLATPGSDPLQQAQRLLAASQARLLALTVGAQGAWLLQRDGRIWRARNAAPLKVVDTVGAGDCFLAGTIAAWLRELAGLAPAGAMLDDAQGQRVLAHGLAGASVCVTRRGCDPGTWDEVQAALAQVDCSAA